MKTYIDSDILIWYLRGKKEALSFLQKISGAEDELVIGAMQRAEVVFFMRPEEESATLQFLDLFDTISVNREIIDIAGRYYRKYRPATAIDINDAILAASCSITGGRIYTLNKKHYPMREITVQRAW
ncbi:MAG: PIN domain-containing protein [Spirochaetes bacterium]|nr:PIN domain-containing protein [Spirochaetota bacterium]